MTECGDYSLWSCFIGILPESEIIWEPARQYAVTHILVSRLTEIISDGRTHYILERQRERGNVFGKKSHTNGVLWLRSPWWRVLLEITQLPVKGNRNNDRRRKQTCSDFLTDSIKKTQQHRVWYRCKPASPSISFALYIVFILAGINHFIYLGRFTHIYTILYIVFNLFFDFSFLLQTA